MSGKVFTFPQVGNSAHVRLTPLVSKILFSATVCLRFYTDISSSEIALFSMATPTQTNSTGMSQFTVNGIHSVKKATSAGGSIAGTPIIILGQDQDSYGGSFEIRQAFTGHITDVHMWDHAISTCEIKSYMQGLAHSPVRKLCMLDVFDPMRFFVWMIAAAAWVID
ncbi:female protein-like [Alosa pseudoharengus]|uniref:female protein-like n=1 Tax=Alosa pseudoharengus TaxID=34774 RepID=UPI003F8B1121